MIIDVSKITAPEAEPIDPLIADIDLGIVKAGPKGLQGDKGWTAVLAIETDGARRVQKVIGWTGGGGAMPPAGKYVGPSGLVDDIGDAVDIRGPIGATGVHTTGASVDGSYHLIISLSDGSSIDAGYVRGQPGTAATVTVNTVTTLPPGSPATVTNVGTSTAALLNFGIPKGDTGASTGGTVTSVAATVPTGLSVSGTPITTSGTLAFSWASGYQAYTTAEATKLAGIASGATANAGTVTSVGMTVPTGLSVTPASITTNGTFVITYTAGYQGYTTTEATKLSGITAGADPTGATMAGATAKTTPVDADTMPLNDSAASNALKKVTWANIKATLKTYFDTLYQATSAKLTALAGQTWAADQITYQTSASAVSATPLTAFARTLLDDANQAAAQTTLGLVPGTNVQGQNAKLQNIAGLVPATGDTIIWNGTAYVSQAPAGGSSVDVSRKGWVSVTSLTTGTGQDAKYIDVTVSAVADYTKTEVNFTGGASVAAGNLVVTSQKSGSTESHICSARMTSNTNVRISCSNASALTLQGYYVVEDYN